MKQLEYRVVTSSHHSDFVDQVNAALRNGWEIRGTTQIFLIDNITLRFVMEFTRERRS